MRYNRATQHHLKLNYGYINEFSDDESRAVLIQVGMNDGNCVPCGYPKGGHVMNPEIFHKEIGTRHPWQFQPVKVEVPSGPNAKIPDLPARQRNPLHVRTIIDVVHESMKYQLGLLRDYRVLSADNIVIDCTPDQLAFDEKKRLTEADVIRLSSAFRFGLDMSEVWIKMARLRPLVVSEAAGSSRSGIYLPDGFFEAAESLSKR